MDDKRIVINPDGQVLPCCYLANMTYFSTVNTEKGLGLPSGHRKQMEHPLLKEYVDSAESYNIFKNDIETILNGKWFIKTLPESWEKDEPHHQCALMCGVL